MRNGLKALILVFLFAFVLTDGWGMKGVTERVNENETLPLRNQYFW